MTEEWRSFRDTLYWVSSMGRVMGPQHRILAERANTNGYLRVSVCEPGNRPKDFYIHRMVAEAFYGKPPSEDHHADHVDGCRTNNNLTNIRWLERAENLALRKNRYGETSPRSKLTDAIVRQIRSTNCARGTPASLARAFGVAPRTIRDILNYRSWRHIQ